MDLDDMDIDIAPDPNNAPDPNELYHHIIRLYGTSIDMEGNDDDHMLDFVLFTSLCRQRLRPYYFVCRPHEFQTDLINENFLRECGMTRTPRRSSPSLWKLPPSLPVPACRSRWATNPFMGQNHQHAQYFQYQACGPSC